MGALGRTSDKSVGSAIPRSEAVNHGVSPYHVLIVRNTNICFANFKPRWPPCQESSPREPHHPSNFPTRWPCRVSEGRVVGCERLEDGDGRDRDDGGRDWG